MGEYRLTEQYNLAGQRFGRLVVIEMSDETSGRGRGRIWKCRCDCGNEVHVLGYILRQGSKKSCGCAAAHNKQVAWERGWKGKRYGAYTVVGDEGEGRVLCQCECGQSVVVQKNHLVSGRTTSCGHWRRNIQERVIGEAKGSAAARGIEWSLSDEEAIALLTSRCYYCGDPPGKAVRRKGTGEVVMRNGIDRMDPAVGYVAENCVPCCRQCNLSKGVMTADQFLHAISSMYAEMVRRGVIKEGEHGN